MNLTVHESDAQSRIPSLTPAQAPESDPGASAPRHANRSGAFGAGWSIRPEEITLGTLMKAAGYRTAHYGKWHVGAIKESSPLSPGALGFDQSLSHDNFFELNPTLSRNGKPAQQIKGESSKNAAYKPGNLPGQKNVPSITGRGSKGDHIWTTFETGAGRSKVARAFLLYTTNPGKGEEWFRAEATVEHNRVTATAQPGMTHAVFCLLDENNYLIHSEHVPGMPQLSIGKPVSEVLKDGYALRPGLVSLIALARRTQQQAERADQQTRALLSALQAAEETV